MLHWWTRRRRNAGRQRRDLIRALRRRRDQAVMKSERLERALWLACTRLEALSLSIRACYGPSASGILAEAETYSRQARAPFDPMARDAEPPTALEAIALSPSDIVSVRPISPDELTQVSIGPHQFFFRWNGELVAYSGPRGNAKLASFRLTQFHNHRHVSAEELRERARVTGEFDAERISRSGNLSEPNEGGA